MKSVWWCIVLLLAASATARGAPDQKHPPPMPDPCIEAPKLPFCQ